MEIKKGIKLILAIFGGILLINCNSFADNNTNNVSTNISPTTTNNTDTVTNPCNGILAIVDRPSKADSACVVPFGQFDLEGGYQFLDLTGGGSGQNFPQAEFRVGLPFNNEFVVLPPNYNTQTIFPHAGWGATVVGIKHEIGYTSNLVGAVEGLVTLPTGSNSYGSDETGGALNAIATYSLTSALSATAMVGVTSQSLPSLSGGTRYGSFNPDLLVSYDITDNLETFAEVSGQTNAGPGLGYGYNGDVGILYQFIHNTEIDASFGQRIKGNLGGYNNYFGVGLATLFG